MTRYALGTAGLTALFSARPLATWREAVGRFSGSCFLEIGGLLDSHQRRLVQPATRSSYTFASYVGMGKHDIL